MDDDERAGDGKQDDDKHESWMLKAKNEPIHTT
jgi:hypothetical protein